MKLPASIVFSLLLSIPAVGDTDVDRQCPSTAFDRGPKLIGNLEGVRELVRAEGRSGLFQFQATVTETGSVRDVLVVHPKELKASAKVRDAIGGLKFCPAVRHSRDVSAKVNFDVRID